MFSLATRVSHAQMDKEGQPVSWTLENEIEPNSQFTQLEAPNVAQLLEEDIIQNQDKVQPYRFASAIPVSIEPQKDGHWTNRHNGDRVWMIGFRAEGAISLGVLFSHVSIPEGSNIYIYNSSRTDFIGPISSGNNKVNQPQGTIPVLGDEIVVEYYEPYEVRGEGNFKIASVAYGYRDLTLAAGEQPCLRWLEKHAGKVYEPVSNSVQLMLVDNCTRVATGVLLNNTANDGTPYLLTSNAALMGDPESWLFVSKVNYEHCNSTGNCWSQSLSGAHVLVEDVENRAALLKLDEAPPARWNVFYNGWNFNPVSGGEIFCVNHSQGKPQSVAKTNNILQQHFLSTMQQPVLAVESWNDGMIFAGACGSPLINSAGQVIAGFIGGENNCRNDGRDYFSNLSLCWNDLEPFLDPRGLGSKIHDGFYPVLPVKPNETKQVLIFPNPCNAQVNISIAGDDTLLLIRIFDNTGRMAKAITPQFPQFSVHDLAPGTYTINLVYQTFESHTVLIVQ